MPPRNRPDLSYGAYDFWILDKPALPARSYLYALEPIGCGSTDVEGISSYVVRLAWAHGVRTTVLLRQVILPTLRRLMSVPEPTSALSRSTGLTPDNSGWATRVLNGLNECTHRFTVAVEHLTGQTDLRALSMLIWAEVIPAVGLLAPTRRWCPKCYAERHERKQIIYDKLIWSLRPVAICAEHGCALEACCPRCGKTQPSLPSTGILHRCAQCGGELTRQSQTGRHRHDPADQVRCQREMCRLAGDLLVTASQLPQLPEASTLSRRLSETVVRQDRDWLARQLAVNPRTVQDWLSGRNRPELECVLGICLCLGLTPRQLFVPDAGQESSAMASPVGAISKGLPALVLQRRKRAQHDETRAQQVLEQTLLSKTPTSLMQIARDLECSKDYLCHRFPDLSKQVVARYRAYRSTQRIHRVRSQCEQVKAVTLELHARGAYPARHRVAARVGAKILYDEAFHCWQEQMRELGYREKPET